MVTVISEIIKNYFKDTASMVSSHHSG